MRDTVTVPGRQWKIACTIWVETHTSDHYSTLFCYLLSSCLGVGCISSPLGLLTSGICSYRLLHGDLKRCLLRRTQIKCTIVTTWQASRTCDIQHHIIPCSLPSRAFLEENWNQRNMQDSDYRHIWTHHTQGFCQEHHGWDLWNMQQAHVLHSLNILQMTIVSPR